MAFFSKMGNILRQTATKHISQDVRPPQLSAFQAIRWMSNSKLFVGGISYNTDEQSLREAFAKYGEVVDARVIVDRETGRSRGFAFVTYTSSEDASSAIQALDGQDLHGRTVRVNYATERRSDFGGGGGYGGGGYGGGGFGGAGAYGAGGGGGYGGGYGTGGNYGGSGGGAGDGFGSGGNYGSGGSGGNYGGSGAGGNYGGSGSFGGDTYNTGGAGGRIGVSEAGYGSENTGNIGVADGVGASDNINSGSGSGNFASGGYDGSMGSTFGRSDQVSKDESFGTHKNFGDNKDPLDGYFRDGDDGDDANGFAKRA